MAFVGQVKTDDFPGGVGSTLYGVCQTAANVAAKEVAIDGLDALIRGLTIHVKFTNSNRAAEQPTLTIRSVDNQARPIYRHGAVPPGITDRESWYPGTVVALTYDGEAWEMNDWQSDTIYSNATQAANGLMSATDKGILDNIEATRTKSMVFENVATSGWSADSTYSNYPYKATLSCPGVTADHFVQVCFNPQHVVSYVPAPVCLAGQDQVTVWMMINPGASITVPTVFAILPDRT